MKHRLLGILVVVAAVAALAVPVGASDWVGVYGVIKKVVMEPDECAPTRVQIWGVFSLADLGTGGYKPIETGYLYYVVPKGPETYGKVCEREWMDFKALAGKGDVVGFGARHRPIGRVRFANEKPDKPDDYPMNTGLVVLPDAARANGVFYPDLIRALKAAAGVR
jgi:hypothetical protein